MTATGTGRQTAPPPKRQPHHQCRGCRHARADDWGNKRNVRCAVGWKPVDWADGCGDWEERRRTSPRRDEPYLQE